MTWVKSVIVIEITKIYFQNIRKYVGNLPVIFAALREAPPVLLVLLRFKVWLLDKLMATGWPPPAVTPGTPGPPLRAMKTEPCC